MNKPLAALAFAASLSLFAARPAFADDPPAAAAAAPTVTAESPSTTTPTVPVGSHAAPASALPATERRWYGGAILLADLASFGLIVGGIAGGSAGAATLGGLGYVGGGPIIHAVNDHAEVSGTAVGLRLGVPVGAALVGAIVAGAVPCHDSGESILGCSANPVFGAIVGFGAGMVVASIIDVAAFSWSAAPLSSPSATGKTRSTRSSAHVTLGGAPVRGGFTTALSGTF